MHPGGVQRDAQQIGKLQRHVLRGGPVVARQRGNRVQRIEQEVRLKLAFQGFELSVGQLRFQLRGKQFALAILAVVGDGLGDQQHVPVALQIHERARQSVSGKRDVRLCRPGDQRLQQNYDGCAEQGQADTGGHVNRERGLPAIAVKGVAQGEFIDKRSQQRPHQRDGQVPRQQLRPTDRGPHRRGVNVRPGSTQEGQQGPEDEPHSPDTAPLFHHVPYPSSVTWNPYEAGRTARMP